MIDKFEENDSFDQKMLLFKCSKVYMYDLISILDTSHKLWGHGEPNGQKNLEDCAEIQTILNSNKFYLEDVPCTKKSYIICERS